MIEELPGDVQRTPTIAYPAELLAGQILLLRAIRAERRRLLTAPAPPKGYAEFSRLKDFADLRNDVLESALAKEQWSLPKWAHQLVSYAQYDSVVSAYQPTAEGTVRLLLEQR